MSRRLDRPLPPPVGVTPPRPVRDDRHPRPPKSPAGKRPRGRPRDPGHEVDEYA